MDFIALNLNAQILEALISANYKTPTPVQACAIPKILTGMDLRVSAQTGTGKTAAFLLPAIHQAALESAKKAAQPTVLIVIPTRELAKQIATQSQKYSKYLPDIKTVCICGGESYTIQRKKLAKRFDILIATPGRLIDYMKQKQIDLSNIKMLVLDEADRMLDMGFSDAIQDIMAKTPVDRQTLLFSATLDKKINQISKKFMKDPEDLEMNPSNEMQTHITQNVHYTNSLSEKNDLLCKILDSEEAKSTIIFTSTKRHAEQLATELRENGNRAIALHGDMNQGQRSRAIAKFKEGKYDTLVATDVAARGLHVDAITDVINFDLPRNIEDYVHRIGRTGRAGSDGRAHSFASYNEVSLVKRIEKYTGVEMDPVGFVPTANSFNSKKKFSKSNKRKPNFKTARPQRAKPSGRFQNARPSSRSQNDKPSSRNGRPKRQRAFR